MAGRYGSRLRNDDHYPHILPSYPGPRRQSDMVRNTYVAQPRDGANHATLRDGTICDERCGTSQCQNRRYLSECCAFHLS